MAKKDKEASVEKNDEPQQDNAEEKTEDKSKDKAKIGIVTWIILIVIVALCAGSGFFVGRLIAGSSSAKADKPSQENEQTAETVSDDLQTEPNDNIWYYDLEPIVANLDVPGLTRFVRVIITLQIHNDLGRVEGKKLLEEKKPILKNWLTNYLASLTLKDARGGKNQTRIQLQILDAFNEKLFPDAKPQIKRVLFKDGLIVD